MPLLALASVSIRTDAGHTPSVLMWAKMHTWWRLCLVYKQQHGFFWGKCMRFTSPSQIKETFKKRPSEITSICVNVLKRCTYFVFLYCELYVFFVHLFSPPREFLEPFLLVDSQNEQWKRGCRIITAASEQCLSVGLAPAPFLCFQTVHYSLYKAGIPGLFSQIGN